MAIDANQDITVVADTRSAYERIGGGPAVKELVDRFYERVLADRQLARYFTTDMKRLKWHQATLLTSLLGGPDAYEGRELAVAHGPLRIRRRHYERVGAHLARTMESMRVPADIASSVAATVAAVQDQIVSRPSWRARLRRLVRVRRAQPQPGGAA
jgi:hemoglobin